MNLSAIVAALGRSLPPELCKDLIADYLQIRHDVSTRTLGRGAPGKFVETIVQCLQYLDSGTYAKRPDVDKFLVALESRSANMRDDLRICAARIARAMYALRSKRNIVHKGEVDPNSYDLQFLHSGSQWVLAELVRVASNISMEEAGKAISLINSPIGTIVEDIAGRRVVHANVSAPDEISLLLQSHFPDPLPLSSITHSLNRRNSKAVSNAVRDLYKKKLIEGNSKDGYVLTRPGLEKAALVASKHS